MRLKIYQIDPDKDTKKIAFMNYEYSKTHGIDPSVYKCVYNGNLDADGLEDVFRICNRGRPGSYQGHSLSVSDVVEVFGEVPELFGKIDFLFRGPDGYGQVGETVFYTDEKKYRNEIEESNDCGRPIRATPLADKHIPCVEPGIYFCDNCGFKKLEDFDTSKCSEMSGIRVLMVQPGYPPVETRLKNELHSLQQAVSDHGESSLIEITYPFRKDNAVVLSNEESKLIGMKGNRHIDGSVYAGPLYIVGDKNGELVDLTDSQIQKYTEMFAEPDIISDEEVEADSGYSLFAW